jgi:hypothetical protein
MKLVSSLVLGYTAVTHHLAKGQSLPPLATQHMTTYIGESLKLIKNITSDSLLSMEYTAIIQNILDWCCHLYSSCGSAKHQ